MDGSIKVNKVPNLDIRKKLEDSRNIPKMPRLYLELIENKDKIKQGLVNMDYDPDETASDITFFDKKKGEGPRSPRALSEVSEEASAYSDDSGSVAPSSSSKKSSKHHTDNEDSEEEEDETSSKKSADWEGEEQSSVGEESIDGQSVEEEYDSGSDQGSLQSFRKKEDKPPNEEKLSKSQKYQKILNENLPPKLSELEQKGEINTRKAIPNLDRIYNTEDEEEEMKRELLFKFELLKKSYKSIDVPEFNIHSDLKQMTRSYESTLRRVSLDSCVENYKQLLIGGFMVLEFILGYIFKFDMQGYTQQQILNMNQYERLLIELGEQSYVPGGSQWPVEWRLLLMVLGNAAIFIIAKMIMKKTGNNLMGMMNSFVPERQPRKDNDMMRRRMKGPNINPDDIPDISM